MRSRHQRSRTAYRTPVAACALLVAMALGITALAPPAAVAGPRDDRIRDDYDELFEQFESLMFANDVAVEATTQALDAVNDGIYEVDEDAQAISTELYHLLSSFEYDSAAIVDFADEATFRANDAEHEFEQACALRQEAIDEAIEAVYAPQIEEADDDDDETLQAALESMRDAEIAAAEAFVAAEMCKARLATAGMLAQAAPMLGEHHAALKRLEAGAHEILVQMDAQGTALTNYVNELLRQVRTRVAQAAAEYTLALAQWQLDHAIGREEADKDALEDLEDALDELDDDAPNYQAVARSRDLELAMGKAVSTLSELTAGIEDIEDERAALQRRFQAMIDETHLMTRQFGATYERHLRAIVDLESDWQDRADD